MNKLYFKYGAMGSSKTAQALMCRFNYIQKGFKVLTVKPALDTRDKGLHSRIGLSAECKLIAPEQKFCEIASLDDYDVIIVDECQFLTKIQVDELKVLSRKMPVLCYGLLTNFKTELFEGSKRLVELADSLTEMKSVCKCGRKATVNVRRVDGKIVCEGAEILVVADETYEGMCYNCYYNELYEVDKN